MNIRNRIIERKKIAGRDILENPDNWRGHPAHQVQALHEIIDEVGIARTVLAYYSERYDGKLVLIDGHARIREYPDVEWDVDILDVTDEEADKLLLALDNVGDAAKIKLDMLKKLRGNVKTGEALSVLINMAAQDQNRMDFRHEFGLDGESEVRKAKNREENKVEINSPVTGQEGVFYLVKGNANHILYCGDWVDIFAQLEEGVDFLLTDPPYGMGYVSGEVGNAVSATLYPSQTVVGDDKPFDPTDLLNLRARVALIWGGNYFADMLPRSRGWVVWDKIKDGTPSRFSDAELAWTNQDVSIKKISWMWRGMIRQGNDKRYHPTQKPEGVIDWVMNTWWRSTPTGKERKPANIFDPYAGSGTTLVVADSNNIPSISCEIDAAYIAAIGERVDDLGMSIEPIAFEDIDWTLFFGVSDE